ncbi:class I SAM-dependent methyltransferase [Candidatus Pelagibacter communis]|uniref:class I SAM-dependent methyltransferase n=1 Tax=Pelagibacter ubique TaxID=198252 RepID=UPI000AC7B912|nr:class I SAM-dependent methyltransferase [Candidatus Pelagibacter ubique]
MENKNCLICDSKELDLVIDLGLQPWANGFVTKDEIKLENKYPLEVMFCRQCSLAQLSYFVPKEKMFSNHTYLSGVTKSLSAHFKKIINELNINYNKENKKKMILDIGSNDGTFLKHAKDLNWDVLGFESSTNISELANSNGIKTTNKFFNFENVKDFTEKFDFINASGVFFHLEELHSATKAVNYLLKEKGIFVVQFLYMDQIINNCAFDQIYHEHLCYYNLETLNKLLDQYNLEIFDSHLEEIHGGQMIAFVSHKNKYEKTERFKKYIDLENKKESNEFSKYITFNKDIINLKKKNCEFLRNCLEEKKLIFGLGAPVKGNTLLNYFGFTKNEIPKLLEINPLRKNLFAPGSHIPVELENDQKQDPDIFYVLAWNFKKEILDKNQEKIEKGIDFYFPIESKI